ncbi:unnamed protein product [Ilex paraguariensis]|uniref:Uncharacterized protein n=1 Tax=Ilex paraguariensis TaxID=185542 RepID=A0ABC8TNL5_9AQUA
MGSCGFSVIIKKREVVAAVLPTQEHWLPMSNLDLLLPPLDFGVFFCYKKRTDQEQFENMVNTIKKALSQALVSFYALAGEVVHNRLGEPELLCNNRGVDFALAYADVELKDLDLYHLDDSVDGKLVPIKNHGVLTVQVTELRCGGLVIGCSFDHQVADAYSANMFFVAWAQIARGKSLSQTPIFRRSMLNPRRPGQYDKAIDDMYIFLSTLPPPPPPKDLKPNEDHLISRIYHITAEEIDCLQSKASSNGSKRTKLESFTAFLWKIMAEGGHDHSKKCKMGIVVDGRGRFDKALSLENYFGNFLSLPYDEASVGEIKMMALNQVADAVHECVEGAKEEHFLGLIDWVELHRPEKTVAKIYFKESNDEAAIVVSSGQRFIVSEMDFGWGRPDFGSYHFPWGGQTGYVMPMPSISREGDWVVYMHLPEKQLDLIEKEASHVFGPLTPAHWNLMTDDSEMTSKIDMIHL